MIKKRISKGLLPIFLLLVAFIEAKAADPCLDLYEYSCQQPAEKSPESLAMISSERIQSLWQQILKSGQSVVRRYVKPKDIQNTILQKMRKTRLQVEVCQNDPLLDNANYTHVTNTVTYCSGAFLKASTFLSQIAVLAHELGHSFEPCSLNVENSSLQKIVNCLRSEESVQAQVWGFADLSDFERTCSKNKQICAMGISPACTFYQNIGCENKEPRCVKDQINETFADWFSAEVLAEVMTSHYGTNQISKQQWIKGFSDIARSSCGVSYPTFGTYPQPAVRYNKILLANPFVRQKMGCVEGPAKPRYCD